MNKYIRAFAMTILLTAAFAATALAQPPSQPEKIPVKLLVVVSTFEGDRKVSSMPYTLLATANGSDVIFNSASNVPIQSNSGVVNYTSLGTNLRCTVTTEGGTFKVAIDFSDKSVMASKAPPSAGPPATAGIPITKGSDPATFHDVRYASAVTMKEGETKQLISAPDKVTGEIVKIDVTLTLDTPASRRVSVSRGSDGTTYRF